MFRFSRRDRGSDKAFALLELWKRNGLRVGGNCDFGGAEAAGGFGEGGVGASIGPAAAEGDVDAEAEFAAFGLGVVDGVEHGWREEGEIVEAFGWVVENLGVDEG